MSRRAGPQSFPKTLRLLRRAEFRRVYDEGQRRSASLCSVFFRPNNLPQTRLGITTPRALGGSVVRNRIRRRLREVFRLHRATIPAGWDIVLNPRTPMATIPFTQLVKDVLRVFPRSAPMASAEAATPAVTSQPSSAALQRQSKQTSR